MTDLFITAQQARANTVNSILILNEINAIQNAILTAVLAGNLEANVTTTLMTTPGSNGLIAERYYAVWQNIAVLTDLDVRVKQLQMATIISYFQGLSYGIAQRAFTSNTFSWHISW